MKNRDKLEFIFFLQDTKKEEEEESKFSQIWGANTERKKWKHFCLNYSFKLQSMEVEIEAWMKMRVFFNWRNFLIEKVKKMKICWIMQNTKYRYIESSLNRKLNIFLQATN